MQARPSFSVALMILGLGGLACGSARDVTDTGGQVLNSCTTCHGGQDNATGAPPFDTKRRSDPTLASVGAHTAHVQAGEVAKAIDCGACHVKPAAATAPGHLDGQVEITFGGLATTAGATPAYDPQTHGCANVYCHGAFPTGNAYWKVPVWTKGASQAVCGSCHGNPEATPSALPLRNHVRLAPGSTNATCSACHAQTVKADGSVDVAGGAHVNGLAEFDAAAVHPDYWLDTRDRRSHMFNASAACLRCHALNPPATVTVVVCNDCHIAIGRPLPTPFNP